MPFWRDETDVMRYGLCHTFIPLTLEGDDLSGGRPTGSPGGDDAKGVAGFPSDNGQAFSSLPALSGKVAYSGLSPMSSPAIGNQNVQTDQIDPY